MGERIGGLVDKWMGGWVGRWVVGWLGGWVGFSNVKGMEIYS